MERIQCRAARFIMSDYKSRTPGCVTNMICTLNLQAFKTNENSKVSCSSTRCLTGWCQQCLLKNSWHLSATPKEKSALRLIQTFMQQTSCRNIKLKIRGPIRSWQHTPMNMRTPSIESQWSRISSLRRQWVLAVFQLSNRRPLPAVTSNSALSLPKFLPEYAVA